MIRLREKRAKQGLVKKTAGQTENCQTGQTDAGQIEKRSNWSNIGSNMETVNEGTGQTAAGNQPTALYARFDVSTFSCALRPATARPVSERRACFFGRSAGDG